MIDLKNVSFRYSDSNYGVTNINLTIKAGECVVITGKSGCGKTTMTRLVNGLAPKYYKGTKTGNIQIAGKNIEMIPVYDIGRAVGSIFQDPQRQFFSSELEGEIAFGCENYGFLKSDIQERTKEAIHKMRLESIGNISLDLLSSGEKQRTAIASVYALHPQIFVFDESTANLDKGGIAQMKNILVELKQAGHTLLIAEHRINWIGELADRYLYMEDGQIQGQYSSLELSTMNERERIAKGLRCFSNTPFAKIPAPSRTDNIAIRAENISLKKSKKQILKNVNIFVNEKRITAITGSNGAGKTSLALILSGLEKLKEGSIYLYGEKARYRKLRTNIYYCSNDTGTQFFTESVSKELLLGSKHSAENLEAAKKLLKNMHLYDYKDSHPTSLSGGQKQRLAVCCALLSGEKILILDEPTSGLDAENMCLITEALKTAVKQGKTILVITHDEEFIAACCEYRINMDKILKN
ncbi:ABC transporter, ATP-binding protein [Pseudoramibacter alactolyticus ATCC 23263]|uniref:ABC transporter, ATP-binding protein n=1 Tax=Pseudoramibacter alactolyticus ATCC 23263 TaxID=887929 RepID=E6MJY4_9FIRM|nr:energy-coupling factor ABC transporter ATP-binding protein [Pseudoramibacter alactolyticus]EFV00503.1 ABC transporter, ATP-binding protein [Pseudoramibacter alactolyticus ATCC 23263]